MPKIDVLDRVEVKSVGELRRWLEQNHGQTDSILLVTYKKHIPDKYIPKEQILDEILCFGWIDGRRMKLDEDRTMQLLSPRKTQHWSRTYKDRVANLTEAGRMHESGLRSVAVVKENGMWDFLNDVDALVVPDDLTESLTENPTALKNYEAFPDSAKRDILRWIKLAKKPETRARRIKETTDLAAQNKRASGTS